MNSSAVFTSNGEAARTDDESSYDIVDLRNRMSALSSENDSFRQQLHELQRKLETSVTMQSELAETNEALEQTLKSHQVATKKKINEAEEKHAAQRKEFEERIEELEAELTAKTREIGGLLEKNRMNDETISTLRNAHNSTGTEDNSEILKSQLEELAEMLSRETDVRKQLEMTIESKESHCVELKEIIEATKKQQAEKDIVLESMRDQLTCYRMELESSRALPKKETTKGNSLFAEVEDRRKITLDKMNSMRNGYLEAKRSFQAKEAEIKSLKAERAIFLRKWEDDTVERVQQDACLIDKYKSRISELERQLKEEKKKHIQSAKCNPLPESNFTFLQSLLDAKKKEVEELHTKIENDSIHALLEEEARHKIGKQLRFWRFRAMTTQAQLLSIKNRLESDPSSSNVEILDIVKTVVKNMKESEANESAMGEPSYRETTIVDETITTLENLMTIPQTIVQRSQESELSSNHTFEEADDAHRELIPDNRDLPSTDSFSVPIKTENPENDLQKKDSSPDNEKISSPTETRPLKSALVKPSTDISAIFTNKDAIKKKKESIKFTADTIDPPGKTLKKQTTDKPKYPIIFISSNKPKN